VKISCEKCKLSPKVTTEPLGCVTVAIRAFQILYILRYVNNFTVRSGSRCALRLRYVDVGVSIEVAIVVCCCFTVFSCQTEVEVNACTCLIPVLLTMARGQHFKHLP
jgi:hypothetical protein